MTKAYKIYIINWIIFYVAFGIAAYFGYVYKNISPTLFWIGYVFITLSFIWQLFLSKSSLSEKLIKQTFLNVPAYSASFIGLLITFIAGILCMVLSQFSFILGIIICICSAVFSAAIISYAKLTVGTIYNTENEIELKKITIKTLTDDAHTLVLRAETDEMKQETKKVYEALRYSDPMSNTALDEINEQIQNLFASFEDSVQFNDAELAKEISSELLTAIETRNVKCKSLK